MKLWEFPEMTGMNRLTRATLYPYATVEVACALGASEQIRSLNGAWDFQLVCRPEETGKFYAPEADVSEWRTIPVPSIWTLHKNADWPVYTNIKMPFDQGPPHVPEDNPNGLYCTIFTLDAKRASRRTVIHFGGVERCFTLCCNGEEVGFSKGNRTPAEFGLTSYMHEGENLLAVKLCETVEKSGTDGLRSKMNFSIRRICRVCRESD